MALGEPTVSAPTREAATTSESRRSSPVTPTLTTVRVVNLGIAGGKGVTPRLRARSRPTSNSRSSRRLFEGPTALAGHTQRPGAGAASRARCHHVDPATSRRMRTGRRPFARTNRDPPRHHSARTNRDPPRHHPGLGEPPITLIRRRSSMPASRRPFGGRSRDPPRPHSARTSRDPPRHHPGRPGRTADHVYPAEVVDGGQPTGIRRTKPGPAAAPQRPDEPGPAAAPPRPGRSQDPSAAPTGGRINAEPRGAAPPARGRSRAGHGATARGRRRNPPRRHPRKGRRRARPTSSASVSC
jgi:hypothetical protein